MSGQPFLAAGMDPIATRMKKFATMPTNLPKRRIEPKGSRCVDQVSECDVLRTIVGVHVDLLPHVAAGVDRGPQRPAGLRRNREATLLVLLAASAGTRIVSSDLPGPHDNVALQLLAGSHESQSPGPCPDRGPVRSRRCVDVDGHEDSPKHCPNDWQDLLFVDGKVTRLSVLGPVQCCGVSENRHVVKLLSQVHA
jgi:hypothetical protein